MHIVALVCLLATLSAPITLATDGQLPIWLYQLFKAQRVFILGKLNEYIGKLTGFRAIERSIAEKMPERVLQDAIRPTTMDVYVALKQTEQPILGEILSRAPKVATKDEIENMIKDVLKKQAPATKPEIDLLSMTITVNKTYDFGLFKVAFGKVDFGKYMPLLVGGIFGCAELSGMSYKECVRTAYQSFVEQATTGVNKEMVSELDDKLSRLESVTPEDRPIIAPKTKAPN